MTESPDPRADAPAPIPDADQRLMIATELGVIRDLIARDAFTGAGLQHLNHRLKLPAGRIHPAEAHQDAHRQVVLAELHAKLIEQVGMDADYWRQVHRPDVPDDARDLDGEADQ